MTVYCDDIIHMIEKLAPPALAEEWDNVGLLVGRRNRAVTKVLVALDATAAVVDEAIAVNAELILTHHPILFQPIAKLNGDTPLGDKLLRLAEHQIAVYAAHTNLDIAVGGTNDALAALLGLTGIAPLLPVPEKGAIGRMGTLSQPLSLSAFAAKAKGKLGLTAIRFVGEADQPVRVVGLSTGSASNVKNFRAAKQAGCDVFVTGDIRFHEAQEALVLGLALLDATHYAGENLVVNRLCAYLSREARQAGIAAAVSFVPSAVNGQVFQNK